MRHIVPSYNPCPISVILIFIPQYSRCQKEENIDNKSDEQLLMVQAAIEANRQYSDYKMKNITEDFKAMITSIIISIMVQMKNL